MLENLKEEVIKIAQRAQKEGLCKRKSGNFSIRDKESGLVVITPTSKERMDLSIDDIIVMDTEAHVVENKTGLMPSAESLMHLKVYNTRPEVVAVAHTHSMYATVFALLAKPIPAVVYELANLNCKNAQIPVAPYGRPGTEELADSVESVCQEADTFLLEKHGCVACDEGSLEDAYLKVTYIEELAELYYHALMVLDGKEPYHFPQEELQKWKYPSRIKVISKA